MEQEYYALFTAHHRRLINTLGGLSKRVGDDIAHTPELLTYLCEHLLPHARAEEATLYRRAVTLPGGNALVSSMTREHETIVEQVRELGALFEAHEDDTLHDVLRSLVELIYAHFQQEEDALIPLLRQHLTSTEFGLLMEETHRTERDRKPSDIQRFMDMDHCRADRLLRDFSTLKRRDLKQAAAAFASGKERLLRHIVWEEDLLFPAFEDKTGMHDTGPTLVMRQEHVQIKAALERMTALLEAGTGAELDVVEQELVSVLTVHNKKEETILYPMINKSVSAQERNELLEKMQRGRDEG
jgi:hemerythrin-like domain-containing protein